MSLCGSVLFNLSFTDILKSTFPSAHQTVSPVCPGGNILALATGAFTYLLCHNLSESSSYLCVPCSVFQKMTTFVRQAELDSLPSCPDRAQVKEPAEKLKPPTVLLTTLEQHQKPKTQLYSRCW